MNDIVEAYQRTAVNLLKNPDSAEDLCNQFTLLHARGDANTGKLALARRCAALAPNKFIAVFNLASAELKAGNFQESITLFTRAMPMAPPEHVVDAMQHLGLAHYASGNPTEALKWYERARQLKDCDEIQQSIAIARLQSGDLTALFEFECQYHTPSRKKLANCGLPRWKGEDLTGKTIIVGHEQGFGDTIQFSRFIPDIKKRNPKQIIWSGPSSLQWLIAGNFILDAVDEEGPFEADYYTSPIGACGAMRIDYSQVRGQPYLAADHTAKLPERGLKVGLCWAGNVDYAHDHERSMALKDFDPLIEMPGVAIYSLQVGRGEEEISKRGLDGLVANLGGTLKDWRDTARAVMAMDVVVTVDSGVAHLAGALGKSVLILLPYANCWRWMLDRSDTPWYASAKLFRQFTPGQWAEPVYWVKREIEGMLSGRRAKAA